MDMKQYLAKSKIIDFEEFNIQKLAKELLSKSENELQLVQNSFEYVRDSIKHSGDYKMDETTCVASDVLRYKTGWCYSKSHLLAALLRANNVPTGFCYQRLNCSEYIKDVYCLHGLNAVYLKEFGWYRVDVRGNKKGVDAQFCPPQEKLAFVLEENEFDLDGIYHEPLEVVVNALNTASSYEEMVNNFPDL